MDENSQPLFQRVDRGSPALEDEDEDDVVLEYTSDARDALLSPPTLDENGQPAFQIVYGGSTAGSDEDEDGDEDDFGFDYDSDAIASDDDEGDDFLAE